MRQRRPASYGSTTRPPSSRPALSFPSDSDHYRVFTPYWRRWRRSRRDAAPAPGLECSSRRESSPASSRPARTMTPGAPSPELHAGGERGGRRRLDDWLANGLPRYEQDANGSTQMRIATEPVPPLRLHLAVRGRRARRESTRSRRGLPSATLLARLLPAAARREPVGRSARTSARRRRMAWRRRRLERWREGRTGYPIVDAAMRQLAQEGWLPNRARLIVAIVS